MPPFRVRPEFLAPELVRDLLDFAIGRQADYQPTGVGPDVASSVKPAVRVSLGLQDLGSFEPLLAAAVRAAAPDLLAELGMPPIEISQIELQLVAHGDGAFYKRHIDTATVGDMRAPRILSGVLYFHREPKAFSGGALRLYAIGDEGRFVEVEPERNALVVFPSWAPHEVMPVSRSSSDFADSRFAINCWVRTPRP
jgi:Rps23 Pro-64 3,4-dihydroxylase Tpa1-like proline 4-hydroxylase